jgi:hypothetical protein
MAREQTETNPECFAIVLINYPLCRLQTLIVQS